MRRLAQAERFLSAYCGFDKQRRTIHKNTIIGWYQGVIGGLYFHAFHETRVDLLARRHPPFREFPFGQHLRADNTLPRQFCDLGVGEIEKPC